MGTQVDALAATEDAANPPSAQRQHEVESSEDHRLLARVISIPTRSWWRRSGWWLLLAAFLLQAAIPGLACIEIAGGQPQAPGSVVKLISDALMQISGFSDSLFWLVWLIAIFAIDSAWSRIVASGATPTRIWTPARRFKLYLLQGVPVLLAVLLLSLIFDLQKLLPAMGIGTNPFASATSVSTFGHGIGAFIFFNTVALFNSIIWSLILCLFCAVTRFGKALWLWVLTLSWFVTLINRFTPASPWTGRTELPPATGLVISLCALTAFVLIPLLAIHKSRLAAVLLLLVYPGTHLLTQLIDFLPASDTINLVRLGLYKVMSAAMDFGPWLGFIWEDFTRSGLTGQPPQSCWWQPFEQWHFIAGDIWLLPVLGVRLLIFLGFVRFLWRLAGRAEAMQELSAVSKQEAVLAG